MSEPGNGETPPRPGEQPGYPPPPLWQPPIPPPDFQQPTYPPPGYPPPGYQQPTYPPPGYLPPGFQQPSYQQPGYPPPPAQYGQPGYPPYGFGPPPAPVPGGRLAGMGARFGGLVVDTLILWVPLIIFGASDGAFRSTTTTTCDTFSNTCTRGTGFNFGTTWTLDILALVLGVAYSALLVGLQGQTLGHRVAGIRVVDPTTGGVIGPGRAALRWLVMSITGALCTLGYWSPFFDSARRQGWHDKAANSVVIPAH